MRIALTAAAVLALVLSLAGARHLGAPAATSLQAAEQCVDPGAVSVLGHQVYPGGHYCVPVP